MTRAIKQALERFNFAKSRLAQMTPDERAVVTEERLIASFGVSRPDAAILIRQHCGR